MSDIIPHKPERAVGQSSNRYTISQLIGYFAASLPKTSNYPRHARAYVEYCLRNKYGLDIVSVQLYAAGFPPNRVSPLRRFLLFYQSIGLPLIVSDPPTSQMPPAANGLILQFIREAKNLRGDRSKETYTKALNTFFRYVEQQQQAGLTASLSGLTVADFVFHLKEKAYSPFTVNLYLSVIKQLATWCIRRRAELGLDQDQRNALQDVADVRGLAIERTFYKDSLDASERDLFFSNTESARDHAILTLLALEGLRTVEVTRLKVGDLDFKRRQLLVLGKGKYTKKAIKLFGDCLASLQTYLTTSGLWPISPGHRNELLFPNLKTHQIRYIVDKQLRKHGLKRAGLSAHSLRHTVGQLLLEQGVNLEHVQQHLRHETLETTQFYTRKKTSKTYFQQMPD